MATAKRPPSFEVYKTRSGWRWRLKAANGEIVACGQGYKASKRDALRGVASVVRNAAEAVICELA